MPRKGKFCNLWYPVSKKWYDSWLQSLDGREPGPIDNSDLVDKNDKTQLKKTIKEDVTHKWVTSELWDLWQSVYGGGPALPRKVYERHHNRVRCDTYKKEKYIRIWPIMVTIYKITKDNDKLEENKFEMIGFPRDWSLESMATYFERPNNYLPKVHLWVRFEAIKEIYRVTKDDIKDEDPKRFVEVPDDCLRRIKLGDMNFGHDRREIIVEYLDEKENEWPLAKTDETWKDFKVGDIIDAKDGENKWYEGVIRCVGKGENEGKLAVHYIGWEVKKDEWIDINGPRLKKRNTESKGPFRPHCEKFCKLLKKYKLSLCKPTIATFGITEKDNLNGLNFYQFNNIESHLKRSNRKQFQKFVRGELNPNYKRDVNCKTFIFVQLLKDYKLSQYKGFLLKKGIKTKDDLKRLSFYQWNNIELQLKPFHKKKFEQLVQAVSISNRDYKKKMT